MIVGITIGAVAEALLFAAKGGADMAKVREAISGGFADSRILQLHGQRMVDRDFAPRGRMTVQLKDLDNALITAQEIGFDAPITALFEALYKDGVEHGLGQLKREEILRYKSGIEMDMMRAVTRASIVCITPCGFPGEFFSFSTSSAKPAAATTYRRTSRPIRVAEVILSLPHTIMACFLLWMAC